MVSTYLVCLGLVAHATGATCRCRACPRSRFHDRSHFPRSTLLEGADSDATHMIDQAGFFPAPSGSLRFLKSRMCRAQLISLGATWRSGDAPDCKSVNPGSIPGVASIISFAVVIPAMMFAPPQGFALGPNKIAFTILIIVADLLAKGPGNGNVKDVALRPSQADEKPSTSFHQ